MSISQIIGSGTQATHVEHGRDSIQALSAVLVLLGKNLYHLNESWAGDWFGKAARRANSACSKLACP
ncbi:MAG: hypothetical protein ACT4OT_08205 [Acidobacteriota bacterium]